MGRTYLFECPKCGYRATVAGGAEQGFHFAVQTVLCAECKQLLDTVTRYRMPVESPMAIPLARKRLKPLGEGVQRKTPVRAPTFAAALGRLPPPGVKWFQWLKFKPACPVSTLHPVREWKAPDRCPKCGVLMEQNALPYRIWD